MYMRSLHRRHYLTGAASLATVGVAGCIGDDEVADDVDDPIDDDDDTDDDDSVQPTDGDAINYIGLPTVNPFPDDAVASWDDYTEQHGREVNQIAISNEPGDLNSTLMAGGGQEVYDLIGVVGSIHEPLIAEDVILPLDEDRYSNWDNQYFVWDNEYGRPFFMQDDEMWAVPTIWQGDSMAYLPEETGEITSYDALFSEEFQGRTAIENNWTVAGVKTAMYLRENNLADITSDQAALLDEDEIVETIDFLIEKKDEGQFRSIWTGFETAVDLLANEEAVVVDTWEPVVFALNDMDIDAEYAVPDEGYLLWGMANYLINNPNRSDEKTEDIHEFLDWQLDGWYGAAITMTKGYATNEAAIDYAEENPDEFDPDEVKEIHDNVIDHKFLDVGGDWHFRWPENQDIWEREWERFMAA